MKKLSHRRIK